MSTDKLQIDEKTRHHIERITHGRPWKLTQVRPDDYLIVIGKDDVYAVRRMS